MSDSFMGTGWKFPVEVDSSTGKIKMAQNEEDIAEAIRIILSTARGERVMRPSFGCGLHSFVFGSTDRTTLQLLETDIREAIIVWEPRVDKVTVEINVSNEDSYKLEIRIGYVVRQTNNLFNMVYPFYLNEGTR